MRTFWSERSGTKYEFATRRRRARRGDEGVVHAGGGRRAGPLRRARDHRGVDVAFAPEARVGRARQGLAAGGLEAVVERALQVRDDRAADPAGGVAPLVRPDPVAEPALPDAEPADERGPAVEHEDPPVREPERVGPGHVRPELDAARDEAPLELGIEPRLAEALRPEPVEHDAAGDPPAPLEDRLPDPRRRIALAHPHELADVDVLAGGADLLLQRVEDGAVLDELDRVAVAHGHADLALEEHVERDLVGVSQHAPGELGAAQPAGEVPPERGRHRGGPEPSQDGARSHDRTFFTHRPAGTRRRCTLPRQ